MNRNIEKGYGTVSKVVTTNNELSIGSKGLYAYLCSFAGGTNEAFPSIEKMSFDLNCNSKTINKYIKELVANDVIKKDRMIYTKTHKYANNVYTIIQ
jgi:hypothetical protein